MARSRNSYSGVVIGPVIIVVGLLALWKNEGRFDYARAARNTTPMNVPAPSFNNKLISYTGSMETDLKISGEYVESLIGYLSVNRSAEIYAWDRDEDSDGHVTWNLKWMTRLDRNSRNNDIQQRLSSKQFRPKSYNVGKIQINEKWIEFVDPQETISLSSLKLTDTGEKDGLKKRDEYLYLAKNRPRKLGDERISYRGLRVPPTATYFGEYKDGRGVAYQAEVKSGLVDRLIQDTGILHFIVAGERPVALTTMQSHLTRLRWFVRGSGFLVISIGFMIMFSAATGFLYHVPVIGAIAQWGTMAISFILGGLLGIIAIASSYLIHHPLTLGLTVAGCCLVFWLARKRATQSQTKFKQALDTDFGHTLSSTELEELEFIELLRICFADKEVHVEERKYLTKWAKQHGWDREKIAEMVAKAKSGDEDPTEPTYTDKHLRNLIRLALADGKIKRFELNTISKAANEIGYSRSELQRTIQQVRTAGPLS
ncbi:MAG: hypothetical protein GY768_26385 [Planctomycetaceae bacterium]|nr:hypothetical protein [Planctomycetaceae bacterium]